MAFYKKDQAKNLPSNKSPYKKQIIDIAKLANYQPRPSILPPSHDFNFTVLQNGHLKRKPKQDLQSIQEKSSKIKENQRLPYSPSNPRQKSNQKHKQIQHHPTNTSEQYLTVDTRLQTEEALEMASRNRLYPSTPQGSLSGAIQMDRNQSRQKISRRYHKNNQKQKICKIEEEQDSEGETEYEYDTTPGPGYYSVNNSTFQSSSSSGLSLNRNSFGRYSFGSKAERFIINPEKEKQEQDRRILYIKRKQEERQKRLQQNHAAQRPRNRSKIIPFLSGSVKYPEAKFDNTPSPQQYKPREGIEEQLIEKIQRNFKGSFGVCQQRFRSDKNFSLGPGQYSPSSDKLFEVEKNLGSHYFESKKERFK